MVARNVEAMNMILKGFTRAVVIYSNPLLSLFSFELPALLRESSLCRISSHIQQFKIHTNTPTIKYIL